MQTRYSPALFHPFFSTPRFLKHCSIHLRLVACFSLTPQVHAAKASSLADFINTNRRGSGIVVNTPKYDRNARVFFLFYLGYNSHQQDKLEAVTKPMIPVYKKMAGSGAELVMYLDFPPEQQADSAKPKKGKARRTATTDMRALTIKCPVINVYRSEAREALFKKDARGKEQSYGTYDLRAVDAKGNPLAYFSYENGEIMMRDATTGEKKSIDNGGYSGNEWLGPAILASYREMVAKVNPDNASTDSPAQSAADEAPPPQKRVRKNPAKSVRAGINVGALMHWNNWRFRPMTNFDS